MSFAQGPRTINVGVEDEFRWCLGGECSLDSSDDILDGLRIERFHRQNDQSIGVDVCIATHQFDDRCRMGESISQKYIERILQIGVADFVERLSRGEVDNV